MIMAEYGIDRTATFKTSVPCASGLIPVIRRANRVLVETSHYMFAMLPLEIFERSFKTSLVSAMKVL